MSAEHTARAIERLVEESCAGAREQRRDEVYERVRDDDGHAVARYVEHLKDGEATLDDLVEDVSSEARG